MSIELSQSDDVLIEYTNSVQDDKKTSVNGMPASLLILVASSLLKLGEKKTIDFSKLTRCSEALAKLSRIFLITYICAREASTNRSKLLAKNKGDIPRP